MWLLPNSSRMSTSVVRITRKLQGSSALFNSKWDWERFKKMKRSRIQLRIWKTLLIFWIKKRKHNSISSNLKFKEAKQLRIPSQLKTSEADQNH